MTELTAAQADEVALDYLDLGPDGIAGTADDGWELAVFGNFGSSKRLDFTVLGPAVNEASRIGGMCRSLEQRVIVSSAFAESAGPRRRDLVSLGRYALRGVGQPQELFTIDRAAAPIVPVRPLG